jgi:hypothetical protein
VRNDCDNRFYDLEKYGHAQHDRQHHIHVHGSADDSGGQIVPVPVANVYNRTFAQTFVNTTFDVAISGAMQRYQLTACTDAIQFGNQTLWPGTPIYTDTWSATGTTLAAISETMVSQGYEYFGQTWSYARPQWYNPVFGFTPQVSAEVSGFQWQTEAGLVPAAITGSSLSISFP